MGGPSRGRAAGLGDGRGRAPRAAGRAARRARVRAARVASRHGLGAGDRCAARRRRCVRRRLGHGLRRRLARAPGAPDPRHGRAVHGARARRRDLGGGPLARLPRHRAAAAGPERFSHSPPARARKRLRHRDRARGAARGGARRPPRAAHLVPHRQPRPPGDDPSHARERRRVSARRVLPRRGPGGRRPAKRPLASVRGARLRAVAGRPDGHLARAVGDPRRAVRAHGRWLRPPTRRPARGRRGRLGHAARLRRGLEHPVPERGRVRHQARGPVLVGHGSGAAVAPGGRPCALADRRDRAGARHDRHARLWRDPVHDHVRRARPGTPRARPGVVATAAPAGAHVGRVRARRAAVPRVARAGRLRAREPDPHRDPGDARARARRARHLGRGGLGLARAAVGAVPALARVVVARGARAGRALPAHDHARRRHAHVPATGGGGARAPARLPAHAPALAAAGRARGGIPRGARAPRGAPGGGGGRSARRRC